MKIDSDRFRVREDHDVDLGDWPTRIKPYYESDADYKKRLRASVDMLARHQQALYASNSHAILLIFQAMDAAGKDGIIRHVLSGINPQGCQVVSFQHPTPSESRHDFLWRATRELPERGRIGVFNRSYYEEVLIARVHPEILRAQNIPDEPKRDSTIWRDRFQSIVDLEGHLQRNGTRIVKFYLHLSPEEQRKRFLDRIDDPTKNWKFTRADLEERQYWAEYMKAYEACLGATSTKEAPWHIVPADDKPNARLIVARIVLDLFKSLDLQYPKASPERIAELAAIRDQLVRP